MTGKTINLLQVNVVEYLRNHRVMKILNRTQKVLLKEHIHKLDYIKINTLVHQRIPLKNENANRRVEKDICNTLFRINEEFLQAIKQLCRKHEQKT